MNKPPTRHALWACTLLLTTAAAATAAPQRFKPVFESLRFERPVYITHPRDGTDRLVVVEQAGRVLWFDRTRNPQPTVALDIRRRVHKIHYQSDEQGLLGLAFAPDFAATGHVYLHYNPRRGKTRNILSRFTADPDTLTIDPRSEQVILEVAQPYTNHNGGMIEFGPDGFLYVALGDGGSTGDPHNHGQNKATLLGSILRIDPDPTRTPPNQTYCTPPDNPFAGAPDARPEIWAYGLRNPWRFSFDRETGDLWAGDVGQHKWEEVDLIVRGGNYGWNHREGSHPFKPRPTDEILIDPVVEHERAQAMSMTGGYVYRGAAAPDLHGAYIYGDYLVGLIWAIRYDGQTVTKQQYLGRIPNISSFGEDRDGELHLTTLDGRIYRLTAPVP